MRRPCTGSEPRTRGRPQGSLPPLRTTRGDLDFSRWGEGVRGRSATTRLRSGRSLAIQQTTSIATARTGAPSEPPSLMGSRLRRGFGKSRAARLAGSRRSHRLSPVWRGGPGSPRGVLLRRRFRPRSGHLSRGPYVGVEDQPRRPPVEEWIVVVGCAVALFPAGPHDGHGASWSRFS